MPKITSTADHVIRHAGGVWRITGKDFPARDTFRVYRIEGDINRIPDVMAGIQAMLATHGVTRATCEFRL